HRVGALFARPLIRRRGLAAWTALGAGRTEIARQVLLEAVALVAIGAGGGVMIASWMAPAGGRLVLQPFGAMASRGIAVSWPLIAVVLAVALACAAICGLLPAAGAARWNVSDVLRRGATTAPAELRMPPLV